MSIPDAAYRSKSNVIPKPAESYLLRQKHKNEWLQRLCSAAVNAHNRIPLDIQNVAELCEFVGKLSLFSLNEIQRQILLTVTNDTRPPRRTQRG